MGHKMTNFGKCETCKHWDDDKPSIQRRACNKIGTFDEAYDAQTLHTVPAIAFGEYGAHLQTRADFGCVLWAPRGNGGGE